MRDTKAAKVEAAVSRLLNATSVAELLAKVAKLYDMQQAPKHLLRQFVSDYTRKRYYAPGVRQTERFLNWVLSGKDIGRFRYDTITEASATNERNRIRNKRRKLQQRKINKRSALKDRLASKASAKRNNSSTYCVKG